MSCSNIPRALFRINLDTDTPSGKNENKNTTNASQDTSVKDAPKKKKTMAELDEELRMKLEGRSGDGGADGIELEGGKPVAMKRGVRENMFRLI